MVADKAAKLHIMDFSDGPRQELVRFAIGEVSFSSAD